MINALIAGLVIACVAGPLGAMVIWRRLSFLGDALSHATLLGVALAALCKLPSIWGMLCVTVGMSCVLVISSKQQNLSRDTWLAILAHSTLGLGLVLNALLQERLSIINILFGDILAISTQELAFIVPSSLALGLLLILLWRRLVMIAVNRDLAILSGANVDRLELVLMLIFAACVAIASYVIGAMLVTALLLIPAATAHTGAKTPERMALLASFYGGVSVLFGLGGSWIYDLPAAPSIVVASVMMFALSQIVSRLQRRA